MHVILATRGILRSTEEWQDFMRAQMWKWLRWPVLKDEKTGEFLKNPDGTYKLGEPILTKVQGALRPIQLWEYVIPEKGVKFVDGKIVETDNLPEAFAMMNERKPWQTRPDMVVPLWILRKAFGAEKIPEMPILQEKEPHMITEKFVPSNGNGVAVYAAGIRKDKMIFMPDGKELYWQEGL